MSLRRILSWSGILLFLTLFFFLPLARILLVGLDFSALGSGTLPYTLRVLGFTLFQALLSTLLTFLLGLPAAVLLARFEFRGRSLLRMLTAIPFMLPTVVVASAFTAWLGARGWFNLALQALFQLEAPPVVFSGTLGAILTAHVFYNATIVIRMVGNSLNRLDPRLAQAAQTLGASPRRLFLLVTLPILRPALISALLLVFFFNFTSFGVILLLGGPQFSTLEVEIYTQALTFLNLPLAAWLTLVQLVCTLVFAVLYSRLVTRQRLVTEPRADPPLRPRSWRQRLFVAAMSALLCLFFALPLVSLPLRSVIRLESERGDRTQVHYGLTLDYYAELFINRRGSAFHVPPGSALLNSVAYAGLTMLLALLLGFPAARALARPGRFERLIDPLLLLPLGASAVTLGLGFILAYGRWLASPWLVPLAHTLIALPFVIRVLQPALASIPDRLRQAAVTLGASPARVLWEVDWRLVRRPVLSAAVFAFTVSLGEFGATALLYRPEYPTLPVAIYRFLAQPGGMNYGQAMAMATILMVVAGAGILLIEKLRLPSSSEF